MDEPEQSRPEPGLEQDGRFPSGPWKGFFLQAGFAGRQWMELNLTFSRGKLRGEGRDWVGEFLVRGRYEVESGKCRWTKLYVGKHDIAYQGYNEGKGIWGMWEWPPLPALRGGFRIWPVGMGDPTLEHLAEEMEGPDTVEIETQTASFAEVPSAGTATVPAIGGVRRPQGPGPRPRGRRRSARSGRSSAGGYSRPPGSPA